MKAIKCEMCGSGDLIKKDGVFICQFCGCQYSPEEVKKMMIEGTVKIDESDFTQNSLKNARRALQKDDWDEAEKYYNMVERNSPENIEAIFFSAFSKAMNSMYSSEYYKRQQIIDVFKKSISVISDYYTASNKENEEILRKATVYVNKMSNIQYVFNPQITFMNVGSNSWCKQQIITAQKAFKTELEQIYTKYNETYVKELINTINIPVGGCYVATCVYGSYDCPQVWTLRRYRDYKLASTWYGRAFIRTYYTISPTLVKWFGKTKWFKKMWKGKLDKMVKKLKNQGFENTPYNDIDWRK